MKGLRNSIPFLGMIALIALFFKLPEMASLFEDFSCPTCVSPTPFLPLIGVGYFALLIALALLFPLFPSILVARGGLVFSLLLAVVLIYFQYPAWCVPCLIAHGCNIAIWAIWKLVPKNELPEHVSSLKERLCLAFFGPVAMIALFSCLNLTSMAYKSNPRIAASGLRVGAPSPSFTLMTHEGRSISDQQHSVVLNFISPNCPYCKEQLPILNAVATILSNGSYRFVTIAPELSEELIASASHTEWVEDREGELRSLFKVSGYPTVFIIDRDRKIREIIPGVPDDLKNFLLTTLIQ